jgi:mannose PTS system EIIA component
MKIIVATHGELAKALVETVQLIIGDGFSMDYYCLTQEKSGDAGKKELTELILKEDVNDLVVFTDVFGGSVNNICLEILISQQETEKFHLISGVNLPLILAAIMSGADSIEAKLTEAIEEAQSGIKYINNLVKGVV